MQIGIDSFAAAISDPPPALTITPVERLQQPPRRDRTRRPGRPRRLRHRRTSPRRVPRLRAAVILAAAAARTKNIRLTSAVTVLSAADPVRVFQEFATLDLISHGRAEIVAGRGSFIESYPALRPRSRRLRLALRRKARPPAQHPRQHATSTGPASIAPPSPARASIRARCRIRCPSGSASAARPTPSSAPACSDCRSWSPSSAARPHRFRPLIDLYREAGRRAGHPPEKLKVGLHSIGFLADTTEQAADDFFPGYAHTFTEIGKERGWPPTTRGAVRRPARPHRRAPDRRRRNRRRKNPLCNEALGGISRLTFQMGVSTLPHQKMMHAIEILGTRVAPIVRKELTAGVARDKQLREKLAAVLPHRSDLGELHQ